MRIRRLGDRIYIYKDSGMTELTPVRATIEERRNEAQDVGYRQSVEDTVYQVAARVGLMIKEDPDLGFDLMYVPMPEGLIVSMVRQGGRAVRAANERRWYDAGDETMRQVGLLVLLYDEVAQPDIDEPFWKYARDLVERVGLERTGEHFAKFGAQRLSLADWQMVLVEEHGEIVDALAEGNQEEALKEVAQTIACWIRFANEVTRMASGVAEAEAHRYTRAE